MWEMYSHLDIDGSPPGPSVRGISLARILEWIGPFHIRVSNLL